MDEASFENNLANYKESLENKLEAVVKIPKGYKAREKRAIELNRIKNKWIYEPIYARLTVNKDFKASDAFKKEIVELDYNNEEDFMCSSDYRGMLRNHMYEKAMEYYKKDSLPYPEARKKVISEISVRKILANRVLILRISNIISYPNKNKRKLHKTFSDIFFEMAKKGFIYKNNKAYKDFISIKKFNQIVLELIKKNSFGLFNVSLGKKIYLNQLITWLNFYNSMKIKIINPQTIWLKSPVIRELLTVSLGIKLYDLANCFEKKTEMKRAKKVDTRLIVVVIKPTLAPFTINNK